MSRLGRKAHSKASVTSAKCNPVSSQLTDRTSNTERAGRIMDP